VEDDARTPDNEVSESRVSQLHTRAIQNLRSILSP
jgi:DNA-directed RNA polymerase specialized sigma subunit